jgi:hypothetical protein
VHYYYSLIVWLDSAFPVLRIAEDPRTFSFDFYRPSEVNMKSLGYFFGGVFVFLLLLVAFVVQYNRWRKFNQFKNEVQTLDLDPSAQGTFSWMVKQYRMKEPITAVESCEIFDQMATDEIFRVLCSDGTLEAKEDFIDTVYDIRNQTFHPDRVRKDKHPITPH